MPRSTSLPRHHGDNDIAQGACANALGVVHLGDTSSRPCPWGPPITKGVRVLATVAERTRECNPPLTRGNDAIPTLGIGIGTGARVRSNRAGMRLAPPLPALM